MYIPREYKQNDKAEIIAFMKRYSFGIIVTEENGTPIATHIPFHVGEDGDDITLSAHFAKGNPQWKEIGNKNVLVIFSEPHAYVSPSHYDREQSVPTWNYVAVHAYGRCSVVEDKERGTAILEEMILQSEPAYKAQWDGLPESYKMGLYNGIVPVEITITELKAVNKLSQDKKLHERQAIASTLEQHEDGTARDIAEYMKKMDAN